MDHGHGKARGRHPRRPSPPVLGERGRGEGGEGGRTPTRTKGILPQSRPRWPELFLDSVQAALACLDTDPTQGRTLPS